MIIWNFPELASRIFAFVPFIRRMVLQAMVTRESESAIMPKPRAFFSKASSTLSLTACFYRSEIIAGL